MRRLVPKLAAVALALVTALAGCGGDDGGSSGSSGTGELQSEFVHTVKATGPEVVQIETPRGLGSGVVFDGKGDIVTNAHVVGAAERFRVTFADGTRQEATLVAAFRPDDLAVVRVRDAHGNPATLADSTKLAPGEIVLAVGNPLGLRSSVTNGIVSAVGRTVSEPGGVAIPGMIQTSAAINPGNSGGALVDLDGKVVGIPTLAAVDPEFGDSPAPGIGFAVPSDTVKDIAGQIVEHGHVIDSHRAYLGVEVASTTTAAGAVVAAVAKGGPADRAGIARGDLITAVAGKPVRSAADLSAALAALEPGTHTTVKITRPGGGEGSVGVSLGEYPAGNG